MPLSSEYSAVDKIVKIKIDGRFDYYCHQDFSEAYKDLPSLAQHKFLIDLSRVVYMDSSSLGMLLLLRERAGGERSDIALLGANSEIKKILEISNFKKLFKVGWV